MARISTHVIDISTGQPASAISVVLSDGESQTLGRGRTDAEGRVNDFFQGQDLQAGEYTLTFETQAYFAAQGVAIFYPSIVVHFHVANASDNCHLPLLLSPYGYSTYRGR